MLHEGVLFVTLAALLEFVCLVAINFRVFDGAMLEPVMRLYELNPLRLLLGVVVVLAATMDVCGFVLVQHSLAGDRKLCRFR